ncbi:catechol 2,3-dioxygenase [Litoreibacter ponti]|uniref:Catechol 2,3-dioxygenase n=1 Tax=Litoreibacter ponti TaxID=1510457 RepID=A0A2T6BMB1_9RHOB|nr:VOC family protein [Litoreibacter ponti]PTX57127.1 catechol 2,3-dioxygenase [Litoreibacter ponti]
MSHPTLGHVHLRVSDLARAIAFYRDVVGLEVQQQSRTAAFMSFGGYHHHLGLNTWDSAGAPPAPRGHPGLYHSAFLYPDRASLGRAVGRAVDHGFQIEGAADHGVSEAVYISDPDGNGVELYRDRAEADWPRNADGGLAMVNAPLDVAALVAEGQERLDA